MRLLPSDASAEHLSSRGYGRCVFARQHRLAGAESFATFPTWRAAREWIESQLREECGAEGSPLGHSVDVGGGSGGVEAVVAGGSGTHAASGGYARLGGDDERYSFTGMPTALLAPCGNSWSTLAAAAAANPGGGGLGNGSDDPAAAEARPPWVVCYTRRRTDFPSLVWRLIEADCRDKLQRHIEEHLQMATTLAAAAATANAANAA